MSKELPEFDTVSDALGQAGLDDANAAECHGVLTALLCIVAKLNPAHWLAMYLTAQKAAELPVSTLSTLGNLFEATIDQVDAPDCDFHLLLPGDHSILDVRVESLSQWCQGFLMGLGLGGLTDIEHLPGDLPELVQDIIKISRADSLSLDDEEASENAYVEIHEYLRVAVQMFHEEMKQANQDTTTPTDDNLQQLH